MTLLQYADVPTIKALEFIFPKTNIDLSQSFGKRTTVDTHYNWVKFYGAAVRETDPKLPPERIEDAKKLDKFRAGDRVRVRNSLRALLGTINSREPEGTRRRYVVEFDPRENDAKFLERGVFYADELELCVPVSKTA